MVNLLQNVYLFKGLSNSDLEEINNIAQKKTYNPRDTVFAQEDEAKALYVIKYGSIRIHQKASTGENIEIATLGTGSHFGEMALLDGEKRSASATAIEKSDLVRIDYESLLSLLKENSTIAVHVYRELAHFLGGRLRLTTNDLSFAREKNLSHF